MAKVRVTATVDVDHVERQLLEAVSAPGFGPVASNALLAVRGLRVQLAQSRELLQRINEETGDLLGMSRSPADLLDDQGDLRVRARNAIKTLNVSTVGELASLTRSDVLKLKNVGRKTLANLTALLRRYGLTWRPDPTNG